MIRAWRCWRVLTDRYYQTPSLWSVYIQCQWTGPKLTADYAPAIYKDCHHGIWTFKDRQSYLNNSIAEPPLHSNLWYVGVISGWVQLWGRIVEHDDGYRGQHALIESLERNVVYGSDPPLVLSLLPALQRHYGVELLP